MRRSIYCALSLFVCLVSEPVSAQSWRVESDRDSFTDERRVRAVYRSRDIVVAVRCHEGRLDAIFLGDYVGSDSVDVRYRIDSGEVESHVWSPSTSRDGLFPPDPGEVARRMAAGSRMVFEHEDYSGTPHRFSISLAGSAAPIRQVFDACDLPIRDPRDVNGEIWRRVVDDLDAVPRKNLRDLKKLLSIWDESLPLDNRRTVDMYSVLSNFYSTYWRGCDADLLQGSSCSRWKGAKKYNAEADYPTEAVELYLEYLTELQGAESETDVP